MYLPSVTITQILAIFMELCVMKLIKLPEFLHDLNAENNT